MMKKLLILFLISTNAFATGETRFPKGIIGNITGNLTGNASGTAANVTGTVAIGNGGTGQTSASSAFNAISPVTTTGDLIIGNGANSATRLAIGSNTQVLTSNGTTATWAAGSVSSLPSGMLIPFGGTSCPTGSIAANGASLLRSGTYATLFSVLGTTYGSVDGTHFTLPNSNGVFIRGAGTQGSYSATQNSSLNADTTKKNGLALTDPGHTHGMTVWNTGTTNSGNYDPEYANGGGNNNGFSTAVGTPITSNTTGITLGTGDAETRPANIVVLYCIVY